MTRTPYFIFILICCLGCSITTQQESTLEKTGAENLAYKWGRISLECTANDTEKFRPRPTVTSRILALAWTAAFDAWSRYDEKATPVYLQGVERRHERERTLRNKEIAVSYALYRSMLTYYFSDSLLLRKRMVEFGFDPDNLSNDPGTPEGIGNLAAIAVVSARIDDGSNQTGKMKNSNGALYSDYTGYQPVNSPDQLVTLSRWQPKYFADGNGGQFAPACLTPHWGRVKPLALDSASQFRSVPPPEIGSPQLIAEIKEVVALQANLTDTQRALVEFMRDGPKSVQQAGHWLIERPA
jgi:hypothetical protein